MKLLSVLFVALLLVSWVNGVRWCSICIPNKNDNCLNDDGSNFQACIEPYNHGCASVNLRDAQWKLCASEALCKESGCCFSDFCNNPPIPNAASRDIISEGKIVLLTAPFVMLYNALK